MEKLIEVKNIIAKNGGPLPMSLGGIYKLIHQRGIPSVRVGKRLFILGSWLDGLMSGK